MLQIPFLFGVVVGAVSTLATVGARSRYLAWERGAVRVSMLGSRIGAQRPPAARGEARRPRAPLAISLPRGTAVRCGHGSQRSRNRAGVQAGGIAPLRCCCPDVVRY